MADNKKDAVKAEKKEYTLKRNLRLGSDKKGKVQKDLKAGERVSLTEAEASVYRTQNYI